MQYSHTQKAPLHLVLWTSGIAILSGATLMPQRIVQIILLCSSGLMVLFALSFRQLTVQDEGDRLLIQFGPLPLFWRRIRYADINNVERNRTSVFDGWGIHLSLRGGWTWNLWGFDCVDVYYGQQGKIRIGTDDAERLEGFLKGRVGEGV